MKVTQILAALLERRRRHDRRAQLGETRPEAVDRALRVRLADRHRLPRREPRLPAVVLVGLDDRHRPDRAGRLGHARSSSRRPTRRSRTAASGSSRTSSTTCRAAAADPEETAHPRGRRRSPAAHDVAGRRLGSGDGRARRRFPATPSPARRGRRRSRGRTATSPAHTSRPSSGWCRPRARACSCSSPSTSRTAQIYGGLVAAPAFEQIASFDLQYLEVPPDLRIR